MLHVPTAAAVPYSYQEPQDDFLQELWLLLPDTLHQFLRDGRIETSEQIARSVNASPSTVYRYLKTERRGPRADDAE